MKRKRGIFVFLAIVGGVFYLGNPAQAAHGDHLLISEVQITGGAGKTANDFVEVYNPASAAVDLNGVRLVKRAKTGTGDTTIKSWITETLVPAHGSYLWANSGFAEIGVVPDATTSETIAADNAVALRRGPENTGEIIDAVGWGSAENVLVEGAAFAQNPGAGESIERLPGGADGNGTDTNNNATDFVLRTSADPQNSGSAARPEIVAPAPSPPPSPTEGEGDGGDDGGGEEGESDISESPLPAGEGQGEGQEDHNSPQPPLKLRGGEVVINEFVPDPLEGSEWIELYNTTNTAIVLTGFEIRDGTGNAIAALSGEIAGRGFFIVELTRARLNNGGDVIELYGPPLSPPSEGGDVEGVLIDRVAYGDWDDGNKDDNAPAPENKGHSVARKSNGADTDNDANDFSVSEEPTRGASNVIFITETVTKTITEGGTDALAVPAVVPKPLITINEFVSDPEDGPEWLELYNSGTVAVDLEGWVIEEGAERKTKLPAFTLVPGAWYVVEEIKGNLNNSGDIIRLKNLKDEIVDWVSFGVWEDGKPSDNAPVTSDPYSVARLRDGQDTDNDKKDFAVTSVVTKGRGNVIEGIERLSDEAIKEDENPSPRPSPTRGRGSTVKSPLPRGEGEGEGMPEVTDKLFISELLPNPEGSDSAEWIEIFWGGDEDLRLDGFQLDDGEGGSRPYTFDDKRLEPHAYLVVQKSESRLTLNNVSDAVRLFDPRGKLIDSVEYEEVKEGLAYARDADGGWQWTAKPTPGKENVVDLPSPDLASARSPSPVGRGEGEGSNRTMDVALSKIRELPLGTRVRTQGVVSALPGTLGTQYFYIAGSGAQVYMFKKDFPPLALGDVVQVEGELSETGGERRIKVGAKNDIRVLRRGEPPLPVEISADMVSEDLEGNVVEIAGTIIEANRSGFIIDDGIAETTVAIKSSTAIDTRDLVPGLQVRVAGIVGQTRSGHRVLPRGQEDIEVLGVDELAIEEPAHPDRDRDQSGKSSPYAKATAMAFGGAALAALGVRRRRMFTGGARAVWFILRRGK